MRRVRTAIAATVVTAAAILPTVMASGDENSADASGQNWWTSGDSRAGSANFQSDGDLFTVCDEISDGSDVVGKVRDGQDVVYTIVADGGSGDCERRNSGDGNKFDLREGARYTFEVCLSFMDRCQVRTLTA
ncbi:hypothetical protein [Stackebrandtia nassauensis]|uniref:Secreted protein n=1 Tax=Stackebrandtia nassauensis (strain DSM 44728 / CIP 108903 / NRRL B-16338 / NBRC 102104 / LLR-40K-21) TaxID=446470 RepID=D3PUB0_STANL|nr:hypothetical protein [Stackebrandtia nassauensis]ADD41056.1 hypothetical protein Snas_1348 [Stackebrandtia nassauensis DSM 44728]